MKERAKSLNKLALGPEPISTCVIEKKTRMILRKGVALIPPNHTP